MKNIGSNFVLKFFLLKCIRVVIIGILCMGIFIYQMIEKIKYHPLKHKLYDLQKCDTGGKKDTKLKNKLEGTNEQQNNKNNCKILNNEELSSTTNKECLKVDLNKEKVLKYISSDKENLKDKVINYNDLTSNLNRKDLLAVLETINEETPKNDLISIWSHALGINRGDINELVDKLIAYTEDYINKHNENNIDINKMKTILNIDPKGWNDFKSAFVIKLVREDTVFSRSFYEILKKEKKIEDIKKLIKSFIECTDAIKNQEYEDYIKMFHYLFEKYINSLGKKKKK
ncbi:Plasmodium exported protein (PHISTa), unknown function [Plasmodium sp. DRC-Itaito]|nr:Plasmodium exported protein (PHISTa), unknown function [Plasmodium sp. DRC-Itaito]